MLRTSLRSARVLGRSPIAASSGPQWQRLPSRRCYVADSKVVSSSSSKAPRSSSSTIPSPVPSPPTPTAPASPSPSPKPRPPPPTTPPPPPPPPKRGFFRRLRRFLTATVLLATLTFGGGIVFARYNDNFYDFFTEYIPFAERALLYIEDLDFRQKYSSLPSHRSPQAHDSTVPPAAADGEVRVAANSGASWRVADTSDGGKRTSSAVTKADLAKAKARQVKAEVKDLAKEELGKITQNDKPKEKNKAEDKRPAEAPAVAPAPPPPASVPASTHEPRAKGRIDPVQLLELPEAREPIVQDMVRLINDLITVINADNEQWKYSSAIVKAKGELRKVDEKLRDVQVRTEKKVAKKVQAQVAEFESSVQQLIGRFDGAVRAKEQQWREELTAELEDVRGIYENRVRSLMAREKEAYDSKLSTQLAAQAVALRKELQEQVRHQLEKERDGRLSKLEELAGAVSELEQLTTGWNALVDSNLKTQQLHVALEAVRATIHDSDQSPRPFIRELVALKEVADKDPVVDAAIASIPPVAYQRGMPSPAQLVDRFRRVAAEVRKAALLPEDAGVASHIGSLVLSKVMFKKDGAVVGMTRDGADDVESVLAKTQMFLEEGDLDGAAREMNGLSGWAKALSKDWLEEVRKVLEVKQALDVISTEARLQSLRMETTR